MLTNFYISLQNFTITIMYYYINLSIIYYIKNFDNFCAMLFKVMQVHKRNSPKLFSYTDL